MERGFFAEMSSFQTRRERLRSPLYLRLKKGKTFWKKNLKFEKCKRGALLDLITYIQLENIKKLQGGPFEILKKFAKKVAQCRRDPLGTSGL